MRPVAAFDVDGTLFDEDDRPREDMIALLRSLAPWCRIVVWSGGGNNYAEARCRELDLPEVIFWSKSRIPGSVDITFDDQPITLGTVNIQVGENDTR